MECPCLASINIWPPPTTTQDRTSLIDVRGPARFPHGATSGKVLSTAPSAKSVDLSAKVSSQPRCSRDASITLAIQEPRKQRARSLITIYICMYDSMRRFSRTPSNFRRIPFAPLEEGAFVRNMLLLAEERDSRNPCAEALRRRIIKLIRGDLVSMCSK